MGWTFPDNEIDISSLITYGASWNDVDLSGVVPSGTVFVLLHVRNLSSVSSYNLAARPNGSSEDHNKVIISQRHGYLFAKLDANRVFEGYFSSADLAVTIPGYTDTGSFADTSTNLTPGSIDSYQTVTAPSGSSGAAWLECVGYPSSLAVRPMGSSFDQYKTLNLNVNGWIAGLDANRQFEAEISSLYGYIYYWGYSPDDITMLASPVNKGPSSGSTWTTKDCVSESGGDTVLGVILQIVTPVANCKIRKYGSSDDFGAPGINLANYRHIVAFCGVDANKQFQVWSDQGSSSLFYLIGYIKGVSSGGITGTVDADLAPLTSAGSGAVKVAGVAAPATAPAGAALSGAAAVAGAIAALLTPLSAAAAGEAEIGGDLAALLSPAAAAALGAAAVAGTIEAPAPALGAASAGALAVAGEAAAGLPAATAQVAGYIGEQIAGVCAAALTPAVAEVAGQVQITAVLAAELAAITADLAAAAPAGADIAALLSQLTGSAGGEVLVAGDLAAVLAALTAAVQSRPERRNQNQQGLMPPGARRAVLGGENLYPPGIKQVVQ